MFIHVDSGEVRNQLQELGKLLQNPRPVLMAASGSVVKLLRQHFTARDKVPNKMGGRRTHYWFKVNQSTKIGEVTDAFGTVVIGEPTFAQKVYGGPITPGKSASSKTGNPTKYLSIPARAEAYGKRPAAMKGVDLHFVRTKGGGALVVKSASKQKSNFIDLVMYWLVKRVDQKKDPNALPPPDKLEAAAVAGAESYLRGAVRMAQPNPPTTPIS